MKKPTLIGDASLASDIGCSLFVAYAGDFGSFDVRLGQAGDIEWIHVLPDPGDETVGESVDEDVVDPAPRAAGRVRALALGLDDGRAAVLVDMDGVHVVLDVAIQALQLLHERAHRRLAFAVERRFEEGDLVDDVVAVPREQTFDVSMVAVVGDLEQLVDRTDPRLDLARVSWFRSCGHRDADRIAPGHPAGERADRLVGLVEGEAVRVEQVERVPAGGHRGDAVLVRLG